MKQIISLQIDEDQVSKLKVIAEDKDMKSLFWWSAA